MQKNVLKVLPALFMLVIVSCKAKEAPTPSNTEHVHTPGASVEENKVEPTCTTDGGYDNVIRCTQCKEIISSTHVPLEHLNHDYAEATYEWNSDFSKCTATRVCKRDNTHVETETVDSVYSVDTQSKCEVEGTAKYVATFVNPAFAEQAHSVSLDALNHDYAEATYELNSDFSKCTATRVCKRDNTHVETETVDSVYSITTPNNCGVEGTAKYVATFANSAFIEQTHNVTLDALEHHYVETVVPSTDDEEGYTLHKCEHCQDSYRTNITSAVNKFTYKPNGSGYIIDSYNGDAEYFTIPASYNNLPIFGINIELFEDKKEQIKEVVIEDGLSISLPSIFADCENLKKVYIPDSVTSLSSYCFYHCNSLEEITIPFVGRNKTENNANLACLFGGSVNSDVSKALKKVVIGDACTFIPSGAFNKLSSLTSVVIGKNVTSIGGNAFGGTSITTIHIPKKVEEIDETAFEDPNVYSKIESITVDDENPYFTAEDGILYNKDKTTLISYPCKKTNTEFTVPDSVKTIGAYAFIQCNNLVSISMTNNVETLSWCAFKSCLNLSSVILSNKITEIPLQCFQYDKTIETITLPENLETIGSYAFDQCTKLTNLIIPSTVKSIGAGAFGLTNLTTLNFAGSLRDINLNQQWAKDTKNPQIVCGGYDKPYGVQVNGGTPILVSRYSLDSNHPEFMQFYLYVYDLKAGDYFTLYDAAKQEAWGATIEPYSFNGTKDAPVWENYLDFDGSKYTLKQDMACLSFFIKIGGTNCQVYMYN